MNEKKKKLRKKKKKEERIIQKLNCLKANKMRVFLSSFNTLLLIYYRFVNS